MVEYAYVRVSTKDQNTDRQLEAMNSRGICGKNIYVDKVSGKNFDRPAYKRLMKKLKKGDLIVVKSIDRLGRNYDEILKEWRKITKEKQVHIEVLDMPLLNTKSRDDDLTGVFIADLVLQILAYVAETERTFIKQRQAEGIALAKAKGVKFGRQEIILPDEFDVYEEMWLKREITIRKAAEELNMSPSTFYLKCRQREHHAKHPKN